MLKSAFLIAPICIVASMSALAAESPEASYAAMASELFQSLPKNSTVAIQPLSEEETKIPASILRSIEVGLTSALQRGSDFEVKLIARDRLQTIWKEAREFSNKKFEDMVAEAGAEMLLIGEVRPNADGVEISYRAFRVKGAGTGNVIASSKPRVMAMDWKKQLGATPTQLADTMKDMAEAMKRLAASGGLVADPKTPADFYHNARILAQRGEVDLALSSYEKLFSSSFKFVDPLLDLLSLANRQYGTDGVRVYVANKLKPVLSEELALIARVVTDDKFDIKVFESIRDSKQIFPPLLVEWTKRIQPFNEPMSIQRAYYAAIEELVKSYKSGELQKYYLDPMRGAVAGENAVQIEKNYSNPQMKKQRNFPVQAYLRGKREVTPDFPTILDRVDAAFPVIVCTSEKLGSKLICHDVTSAMDIRDQMTMPRRGGSPIPGAASHACMQHVEYTDTRGIRKKETPLVKFESRLEYRPSDEIIKDIVECAGERLDQQKPIPRDEMLKEANEEKKKKDVEEKARFAEKATLDKVKLDELRGLSTNQIDFNEYVKLERKFKQFLGEEILLGNSMAKVKIGGTYGTLAKLHLEMRDGVEPVSRSVFFEKFLSAKEFLKKECNAIEFFSKAKRESKDAEGYCQPSNAKANPAPLDRNTGTLSAFEKSFGGSVGAVDKVWYEPFSNKPSENAGGSYNNGELMAQYIQKERLFKQFLGEEILLGNSAVKSQLANKIGELAKAHLKLREASKSASQLGFGQMHAEEIKKLKEYCSNIIFMAGGSKRESIDSEGFCKPTNPSGAPGLINPKDSSVVFSFESSFGGKISSIDTVWNEPVLGDRVALAILTLGDVEKKRSEAVTGGEVSGAPKLVFEQKIWANIGGWKIIKSLDFDGCIATNSFKDETEIVFGYTSKTNSYVVSLLNPKWNNIKLDKVERMSYKMSSGVNFSGDFKVGKNNSGNTIIQSAVNRKFIASLAKEKSFQISAKGLILGDISLRNSSKAIDTVEECQRDLEGVVLNAAPTREINSDDKPKPQKPAPKQNDNARIPDPLSIMRALTGGQRLPF
jgi:hypothetical protein